ncbi:MAG: type II CRISPR RNA-guided endonuclease Cas9 [Defluviitaleaceae bacterium]|nr:type II CRISPR RNA-guided endonuclease Cas9 [Defluviitaleaceae bacterium]
MRYNIGLDIGISSVGFAVMELDKDDTPIRIAKIGSRIFDAAENPKDGASLALPRREARGMRRRIRRKRYRKERIRKLLVEKEILTQLQLETLYAQSISDIYELRCDALQRCLTQEELARIMLHLAQRRGFSSNRRTDNDDNEAGKMKTEIGKNTALMSEKGYRTVGEMLYNDERYNERKRNKSDYLNVVTRDMVLSEARIIFSTQREFGNAFCIDSIEEQYLEILSSQRAFDEGPGKGHAKSPSPYAGNLIENMVGFCLFESEKRAAKATYSFERFNLLQKINNIRIEDRGYAFPLTNEQRICIISEAHKTAKLDFSKLRKLLNLPESQKFNTVRYSRDSDIHTDEGKVKFNHLPAYHDMRKALERVSKNRITSISTAQRNSIGQIFSMYKGEDKIKFALAEAGIDPLDIDTLVSNLGTFRKFGHLSAKAIDKILPFLEQGLTYDKACAEAGYNFKEHNNTEKGKLISLKHLAEESENTITSPVVRRALSQCAKVINAIIREMGESPVFINIELAREMAKNFQERGKQEKSMLENNARNERIKQRLQSEFGLINPTGQDIVKLKLYEEQSGICPYSITQMDISRLFEYGYAEIDHIVPRSISYNDTHANKILALGHEQQKKGNRLPLEYLTGKNQEDFRVWVNSSHLRGEKKKRLLKEAITEDERKEFKDRALNDTRTMSRFLFNYLSDYLLFAPFLSGRKRHITAVNGSTTYTLRKRWGLVKLREDGDLHHAADAAIIACTTQKMINEISNHYAHNEKRYMDTSKDPRGETAERFPQPYPYFREELMARLAPTKEKLDIAMGQLNPMPYPENELAALKPVFVSRMPSRKAGGAAHKETIKGITDSGEQVKKVPLTALRLDKNNKIAGYQRTAGNGLLYDALKARLIAYDGKGDKAFAEDFYMPNRDEKHKRVVKTVKVLEKSTLNVRLRDPQGRVKASADHDSMVRVDVFHIKNDGYYLVPIYVADTIKPKLPRKAIVANKPYELWKEMSDDDFIFSLYPNDVVFVKQKKHLELKKSRKESSLPATKSYEDIYAYYKGTNIATGAITIINHDNSYTKESLGVKTLLLLEKCQVDVLGNITKVSREQRQDFSKRG